MGIKYIQTKPSLLEGGLPCASLSAECQRDNNARQRPPQNRLHIWWARRPPTISRAAILGALVPFDFILENKLLPEFVSEPEIDDIKKLPKKFTPHIAFFHRLLNEVGPTHLTQEHKAFLKTLCVVGDSYRAYRRIALREEYKIGNTPITIPMNWTYRHDPAFRLSPNTSLLRAVLGEIRNSIGIDEDIVLLDYMAGGGCIPLEAVRYGLKVYANDLNPVAAITLKATIDYPSKYGAGLVNKVKKYIQLIDFSTKNRLIDFFYTEPSNIWWDYEKNRSKKKFSGKLITNYAPAELDSSKNCYLWCRNVPCSNCNLNIPISTNFHVVTKKGQPKASIAAFPEVPGNGVSNDCTFRIVKRGEWRDCRWPAPDFDSWHPKNTPTFKDGKAICPRCGNVMDGEEVKAIARERTGGLPSQMYAVVSKVPVKLTYKNGDEKIRYMWRFRSPAREDLDAVRRAETELDRLLPGWEAKGLVPDEEVPETMEDKRPRDYGMKRWRDLFLPRQLLTIMVILEEIKKAQARVYEELPADEAQAVSVYLAFILSKVVNYNSVNTFWHYGRKTVTQTFSRHDFAFRPAFCEFEGARETVMWAAEQVMGAYDELARLIHGADADDEEFPLRSEVIVPTVTCEDAAALSTPAPGTVHLICVDPPYYNNVQYSELSNFFYVWLKRSLGDIPGLEHLFQEPLAEFNREAVANSARWAKEAEQELAAWQEVYNKTYETLRSKRIKATDARVQALETAGEKPMTAKERSDRFYEDKMASVFRRAKQLLHPAGRMVVMFNHKQTWAWRSLGMALIRAGFEVRSSAPIHTEAESSLNIRGLDAARSTVLLLCLPREDREQPVGNWGEVQNRVASTARNAAIRFEKQGLSGTDLYLSALGPALGEVGRNWPVTDFAGRPIDLVEALDQAYFAVGQWRLEQILENLTKSAELGEAAAGFTAEGADRDTQTLWLWLDTFQGDTAHSDDVRKLAKSLGVNPDDFNKMGLLKLQKELFIFRPPQEVDLRLLSKRLKGEAVARGRETREADIWEERVFPGFLGAAVWNAISLMIGTGQGPAGIDAVRRWLDESGYGTEKEFFGAFAVTMFLLEKVFANRAGEDPWHEASIQARRAWNLLLSGWRV